MKKTSKQAEPQLTEEAFLTRFLEDADFRAQVISAIEAEVAAKVIPALSPLNISAIEAKVIPTLGPLKIDVRPTKTMALAVLDKMGEDKKASVKLVEYFVAQGALQDC